MSKKHRSPTVRFSLRRSLTSPSSSSLCQGSGKNYKPMKSVVRPLLFLHPPDRMRPCAADATREERSPPTATSGRPSGRGQGSPDLARPVSLSFGDERYAVWLAVSLAGSPGGLDWPPWAGRLAVPGWVGWL